VVHANQVTSTPARRSSTSNRSRKTGRAMSRTAALTFVLPAAVLFGVFTLYPMLAAFGYSFFSWNGTARGDFALLSNYVDLFTKAPYIEQLPRAFGHNILLFVGAIVGQNTIGLGLAYLLHRLKTGRQLFQTLYTMPYLVSAVVVGYLWTLLLSPTFGPLNSFFAAIGLEDLSRPWLGDPSTALWVVILVAGWQWVGFPILLYGAALGGIPAELDEAASIDGATARQSFFAITLPLLVPAITTVSVLAFIYSMEAFALPYSFGGSTGSPAGSTDVLSLMFYRVAFDSGSSNGIGMSSAIATLMFIFIFGIAMLATVVMRRRENRIK